MCACILMSLCNKSQPITASGRVKWAEAGVHQKCKVCYSLFDCNGLFQYTKNQCDFQPQRGLAEPYAIAYGIHPPSHLQFSYTIPTPSFEGHFLLLYRTIASSLLHQTSCSFRVSRPLFVLKSVRRSLFSPCASAVVLGSAGIPKQEIKLFDKPASWKRSGFFRKHNLFVQVISDNLKGRD